MSSCDQYNLSAYHDGELDASERERVEAHLRGCAACARELEQLREASRLLREYPAAAMTEGELRDVHAAVNDAMSSDGDRTIWRIGGSIGVIAASVLVIGLTWLNALPGQPAGGGRGGAQATGPAPAPVATAPLQDWERVAMTLRPDPLAAPDGPIQMPYAYAGGRMGAARYDSGLADSMVEGLGRKASP